MKNLKQMTSQEIDYLLYGRIRPLWRRMDTEKINPHILEYLYTIGLKELASRKETSMKELIERLPEKVRFQLDLLRKDYKNSVIPRDVTRAEVSGYAKGLRDAGLINDRERGMLCVYCST